MFNHWMFRCQDVTELISRSYDEKLPLTTRLGIRIHLLMCHLCARYKTQLDIIHRACRKMNGSREDDFPVTPLPRDTADKISEHLRKVESDNS